MSFYTDRILPPIIDRVLSTGHVKKHRSHVIPGAVGTVVELGFGTGTNLEFYDVDAVDEVLAITPGEESAGYAATTVFRSDPDGPAVAFVLPDHLRMLAGHGFTANEFLLEAQRHGGVA